MAKTEKKSGKRPLEAELISLLGDIDEEGLAYLISQARVLRYNSAVERANEEAEAAVAADRRVSSSPESPQAAPLRLERSDDGKTYHLVWKGRYKLFDSSEMLSLVRLSHGYQDDGDAKRALYAWFSRERGDVSADFEIADVSAPVLLDIARLLRSNFKKPQKR